LPFLDPISKFEIIGTDIFFIFCLLMFVDALSYQDAVFSTQIKIIDSFAGGQILF